MVIDRDLASAAGNGLRIVAIGASAGGLDACRRLLDVLPASSGMAFIFVQHLDPKHESLVASLLSSRTRMPVQEARDGMRVAPDHLYVIPPATYLSVHHGGLHLSKPPVSHGARLPFDFLLQSIAESIGRNGVGIILSGTGSDGSLGLRALKAKGGLVIAQDPKEASYDGMPSNAIQTGAVDFVLPVAEIPGALAKHVVGAPDPRSAQNPPDPADTVDWFAKIIELLRMKTTHDFTLYKPGTLHRRIERRMAMRDIGPTGGDRYFKILQDDPAELGDLADCIFINVTNFFRDPAVFRYLADNVVPQLLNNHLDGQPLRVWVTGCSTGEEAYSLAMVLREKIATAGRILDLQIFASDADLDAIATAREGLYPQSIEADVSAERLDRFFVKDNGHYRVSTELRAMVVFTVHNILTDPPFSRIDLVSCRNLLIYLNTDAQAHAFSVFHFALRDGGILVLGSAESIAVDDIRFQQIGKAEKIYRHSRQGRQPMPQFTARVADRDRDAALDGTARARPRPSALAEFCRRLVLESYAPAAILINRKHECLYALGPVDRYLTIAPGHPSVDLFAMARDGVRGGLRAAIQRAGRENARVLVPGRLAGPKPQSAPFRIAVQPVVHEGENLFLVCFIEGPTQVPEATLVAGSQDDATQIHALEQELEVTRKELQIATRDLEVANEEHRAVSEEASSVTEEYQSTNEELLTSKEELQSLNEELVTLNHQLQETLGRERTTLDDLQNVMHSTDVATLLLDTDLHIRMFTPATKSLFNILPGDVGRPLADLRSLTGDSLLEEDAKLVLRTSTPVEREVQAEAGQVFRRRMLPYQSREHAVEGVVITFVNVTAQRHTAHALEAAKQKADQANVVKSRFLAVASHDLRQPLQTLTLLQGLLVKAVTGDRAKKLVDRFEEALDAMSGILNTLLDINRIEAGTVAAEPEDVSINDLLQRLNSEFAYHAQAKGIVLRQVSCSAFVHTDVRLLEQVLRNFLSNALKYTNKGRVLIGCRRRKESLRIEVWDTGIGIPESEQQAIFEEYHQLDNSARERSRGLGLGLSIVRQLGRLLNHPITVRSRTGKGSVFAVEVPLAPSTPAAPVAPPAAEKVLVVTPDAATGSTFLVIDDDPGVLELLVLLLEDEGHTTIAAADGVAALEVLQDGRLQPDIILADYNLPHGISGLQLTAKVRELLHRHLPAIILTGDISMGLLREIAHHDCVHLNKPVKSKELIEVIGRLLPGRDPAMVAPALAREAVSAEHDSSQTIFIVDDDSHVLDTLQQALEADHRTVQCFRSSEAFLAAYRPSDAGCLLVDANMPGMDGLTLLQQLQTLGRNLPSIMITGFGDVQMAVRAMKAGAVDFIEKPVSLTELRAAINRALASAQDAGQLTAWQEAAAAHIASLTPRQREIMERVLDGHPSKNIAADLGISQRTVENHRAAIMKKTGTRSLPALARLALAATGAGPNQKKPTPKPRQ